MNKCLIVKDKDNNLYLKITEKPLDHSVYFKIEPYNTTLKIEDFIILSTPFLVDLKGEEKDGN